MDTVKNENNNSIINILIFPFYTLLNILVFALKGIKACFYDIWVILFNFLSYRLDKIYKSTKAISSDDTNDI